MLSNEQYLEAIKSVYKKASADPEFRRLCLTDPIKAIKASSGVDFPSGMKIRFAEKLEEQVFVLPPLGKTELSDEELEKVAGGSYWGCQGFSLDTNCDCDDPNPTYSLDCV